MSLAVDVTIFKKEEEEIQYGTVVHTFLNVSNAPSTDPITSSNEGPAAPPTSTGAAAAAAPVAASLISIF